MRTLLLLSLILTVSIVSVKSQSVTITPNGITPSSGHPRLTYDAILALPNPAEGDLAYDLTFKCLRVFNGSKWVCTLTNNPDITPSGTAIASAGGPENDIAQGIAVDGSGNVYITGYYGGTAAFGNTSVTSAGDTDIFIAKYNSSGAVQWVRSAGGTGIDRGQSIAVDAGGNVYVTGFYRATATFGTASVTAAGNDDIFVAKYAGNGDFQWVKSAGSSLEDSGRGIAVAAGNVYLTGFYKLTATFDGTTVTSAGGEDIFMAKYDALGNVLWVRSAGSTGDDRGLGIAADPAGYLYATGYFLETASFGAQSVTSVGGHDIFTTKYNANGDVQWVRSAGGNNHDYGQSIAVSAVGNPVVTGGFQNTAVFEGTNVASAGDWDVFIVKYNTAGSFVSVRSAGGTGYDYGYGIALDAADNAYVTGIYSGTAKFGTATKTSAGSFDVFIAKYIGGNGFQWVQSVGGVNGEVGTGTAVSANNDVYFTGSYSVSTIIGNSTLTSMGNSDIVIGRLEK
jgi:Beta-propeller repeat